MNIQKFVAVTIVTKVMTGQIVGISVRHVKKLKRRTPMAMTNSKKVKRIINDFVKHNGRGPTIKELLCLMQGRKP